MQISRNMHPFDQVLRILLGLIMVYIGFVNQSLLDDSFFNMLLGGFGLLNLCSGFASFCPVYWMAGISSFKKPAKL